MEAFAVPLIDVVGPIRTDLASRLGRPDRIVTDLSMTLRMWVDSGTKVARHHLRTETNAEIWLFVAQRDTNPVDLPPQEFFIVVGTLWAAEDGSSRMIVHRLRQRIAKTWPPDIERIAEIRQRLTDAARRGMLLMQYEKNRFQHAICRVCAQCDY